IFSGFLCFFFSSRRRHTRSKRDRSSDVCSSDLRSIIDPIMKGLHEVIGRFDPEFQQRMLQNIVLGGGGSQLRGLDRVIEEAMTKYGGAKVRRVGDAVYAGAVGALKLAMGMPADKWHQIESVQQNAKIPAAVLAS